MNSMHLAPRGKAVEESGRKWNLAKCSRTPGSELRAVLERANSTKLQIFFDTPLFFGAIPRGSKFLGVEKLQIVRFFPIEKS